MANGLPRNRRERRALDRQKGRKLAAAGGALAAGFVGPVATAVSVGAEEITPVGTTFNVTTTADSGAGSLRDQVAAAEANPGEDTITFGVTGTITLASQIAPEESLRILGPGAGELTVSGGASTNVFYLGDHSYYGSGGGDFIVAGLTIANGITGGRGAAVFQRGGDLAFSEVVLRDNHSNGDGGAVYFDGDNFSLVDSTVSGNTSMDQGGGLDIRSNDSGEYFQTTIDITGSTFTGNEAKYDSGGGRFSDATVTITDSVFTGNVAEGAAGFSAYLGHGDNSLFVVSSTIADNTAEQYGGGFNAYGGNAFLISSTVSDNDAGYSGGGATLWTQGFDTTIVASTISGNSAGRDGGGLNLYSGEETFVQSSTISGNTAQEGGGIRLYGSSTATLDHVTITGNTATTDGGGISVEEETAATISNAILSGNTSPALDDLKVETAPGAAAVSYSLLGEAGVSESVSIGTGVIRTSDPQLGALADNGGPTLTHLPLSGSQAVNAGDPENVPNHDQRGFTPGVVGGRVDMGSVERGASENGSEPAPAPAPTPESGTPPQPEESSEPAPPADGAGETDVTVETSQGPVEVQLTGLEAGDEVEVSVTAADIEDLFETIPAFGEEDTDGVDTLPVAFDVEVTGGDPATATVCFPYSQSAVDDAGLEESDLELFHVPDGGRREVITGSLDTESDEICGDVTSFSPFFLGTLRSDRLAGVDAPGTAAAISADRFEPGVDVAYLVTRSGYADALGAGPAAAAAGGPVLLTDKAGLPAVTKAELERLDPARVVVIGGTAVIDEAVVDQTRAIVDDVERVAGADRAATAASLSAATFAPGVDVAYVVTGAGFADGLVAGAAAAESGGPVLLVDANGLPDSTRTELQRLAAKSIIVVGGTAAVSDAVLAELDGLTAGSATRLAGADRYATAAAVAAEFGEGADVIVATGLNPADGLAGVPAAAKAGAALLLVPRDEVPATVSDVLEDLAPSSITVLGGTAAVTKTNEANLAAFIPDEA